MHNPPNYICTHEKGTQLRSAFLCGFMKWCKTPLVGRIYHCVMFDQQRRYIEMSVTGSVVQGYQPTLILSIHIGSMFQQVLGYFHIIVPS
jgi:hypothetical protein